MCAGAPFAELRDAIDQLPSVSGTVPAGTYGSAMPDFCDVKNLLIYDIFEGTARSSSSSSRAISGMHIK